ncbi:hypothetical protein SAY86_022815 [Trapa natans]|uniref:Protein kinase domain-containing protein n=1 Tax=Trapa natans TaxID=22666 RepID=A0AAN7R8Q9_TRANT|nr:hypothetical protein SAY86_022815 [Trapa natans]
MKCFSFRDKLRFRQQKSAPELKTFGSGAAVHLIKSSCSVTSTRSIPELYEEKAQNLRVFTLPELKLATNGFSRLLKIGEGGFGSIYKGTIKRLDGKGQMITVAIKKLNPAGMQYHADSRKFVMIMDPCLENQFSVAAARLIAKLADSCLQKSAKERPKMSEVVRVLMDASQLSMGDQSPIEGERAFMSLPDNSEPKNKEDQAGPSESWKKRMGHLTKLTEHVEGTHKDACTYINGPGQEEEAKAEEWLKSSGSRE